MLTENNNSNNNDGGSSDHQVTPEAIAKLEQQVQQLNQGIASERTARKTAEQNVTKLSKDLDDFKSKVEFSSEEGTIELSKEDEKKLKSWAAQQGFVTIEQQQAERQRLQAQNLATIQKETVDEFLSDHPDLNSDEKWPLVQAEFQKFKTPMTKKATREILDGVAEKMGSQGVRKSSETDEVARAKAKMINNGRLTLGGGQQSTSSDGEQTVEDLQRKYPNLSRDQIESRLSEIKGLYSGKTGNKKK